MMDQASFKGHHLSTGVLQVHLNLRGAVTVPHPLLELRAWTWACLCLPLSVSGLALDRVFASYVWPLLLAVMLAFGGMISVEKE